MFDPGDIITRSPDVAGEAAKDEYLILDLATGSYYGLDDVGQFIWQQLDGKTTLAEVAERVAAEFKAEIGEVHEDLSEFLAELDERHLIQR